MRPFDLFVSLDALGWTPPHTLQSWLQGGCNGWKPSVQGGFARGVNAGMDVRQFLWLKKEGDQSDGWCLDCAQLTSSMNRCRRFIWRGWFYKLLQVALIKKDPWALGPKVPAAPDTFDFASRSWNCNAEMPGFWDKLIPQKNNQKVPIARFPSFISVSLQSRSFMACFHSKARSEAEGLANRNFQIQGQFYLPHPTAEPAEILITRPPQKIKNVDSNPPQNPSHTKYVWKNLGAQDPWFYFGAPYRGIKSCSPNCPRWMSFLMLP